MASVRILNQYSGSVCKMIDSLFESRAKVPNRAGEKQVTHRGKLSSELVKEKMLKICFLWWPVFFLEIFYTYAAAKWRPID